MTNLFLIFMTLSISLNSLAAEQKHAGQKRKADIGTQTEDGEKKQKQEEVFEYLVSIKGEIRATISIILGHENIDEPFINGNVIVVKESNSTKYIFFKFTKETNEIKQLFFYNRGVVLRSFIFTPDLKHFVFSLVDNNCYIMKFLNSHAEDFLHPTLKIPGINPKFITDDFIETSAGYYDIAKEKFTPKHCNHKGYSLDISCIIC